MTRGKEWRCSSFVSCRKEKKERKKHKKLKMKRNKKLKPRKKEKIFSYSFFFWYENVNLERDNRMRKILRWRVRFACITFVLLVAHREEYQREPKERFGRLSSPELSISFLLFFPFVLIRARISGHTCVACRASASGFVWCCVCVRARGCKYNN